MTASQDKQYPSVSISGSFAPVVGDYARVEQHIYMGTWTDGVAPPPLLSKSGPITSPYRGLSAFGERDEALFFGRESATTDVLELMSRRLEGTGLIVVSGVSGAGKSSLLQAGVLPRLRQAGLGPAPEAASWPCLVFTPGSRPLEELAVRMAPLSGADAAAVLPGLSTDPAGFALTARQAALAHLGTPAQDSGLPDGAGQRRVLLIVDQSEQLFTQCENEDERQAFITALHAAASSADGEQRLPAAVVVIVVRADFEAHLADYPLLAPWVQDRYLLTAMTERQLRMAITQPAITARSNVNEDLVQVLLDEVRIPSGSSAGSPGRVAIGAGVLPLLSHALDQAWRGRTGQPLTLADYEKTGGIEGAVAGSAQRAYDRLTPTQQAMARHVFTRLTATSSDGMDTAARATRADLTDGKNNTQARDVEAVLEEFVAERLLTVGADSVQISHEVLLTAWPLLRDSWLAETHADRIVRTRLHNVATEWARHSSDPSYLYSGRLLQAATETAARVDVDPARYPPLSRTEHDFLHASNRTHQRRARRRRAVIASLLVLTLAAVTAAGLAGYYDANAHQQAANANRQHAIALSRQLAADSLSLKPDDPVTARRLAVAAWRVYPTDQAASAMTALVTEQQQNGDIPVDPPFSIQDGLGGVNAVAFSPDGKLLASADGDGYVRLWDPVTGSPVGKPLPADPRQKGIVNAVAFSPDGKLLASADGDGYVRLWNPATGSPVGKPLRADFGNGIFLPAGYSNTNGVYAVAFSPDGSLLVSAGADGYVRLWDPVTGSPVGKPLPADPGQNGSVSAVEFSPDGKLLASADGNGYVRLWDPVTGSPVGKPLPADPGQNGSVSAVAFSPDGKLLASADGNGYVRLWDPVTGSPVGKPLPADPGQNGSVSAVEFSPDGKLLASAAAGYVRLWDPATGRPVGQPMPADPGQNGSVSGMAFSPDGSLLASADANGYMRLWDPVTGSPVGQQVPADPGLFGADAVAFNHDGKLLASADGNGYVRLWNPVTGSLVGKPLPAGPGQYPVGWVGFSPDGKLLGSAAVNGYVRLWNPVTGIPVGKPLHVGPGRNRNGLVSGVAFSPDGKLLASAGGNGYVRLWDPATGRPVGKPLPADPGQFGSVDGVAFSPDGKLLASAGGDGYVRLWDPATGRPVGQPLPADPGQSGNGMVNQVYAVAFSPDGKLLASADSNGYVRLWDPATGSAVGRPLPADPGQSGNGVGNVAFSPDGRLLASAGGDGYVRLWDPATGRPVGQPMPADPGQNGGVDGVAFSPDGKLLASADAKGNIETWRVWLFADPYAALCADVGPPTKANWTDYAPGEPQPNICASQSRVPLH